MVVDYSNMQWCVAIFLLDIDMLRTIMQNLFSHTKKKNERIVKLQTIDLSLEE